MNPMRKVICLLVGFLLLAAAGIAGLGMAGRPDMIAGWLNSLATLAFFLLFGALVLQQWRDNP